MLPIGRKLTKTCSDCKLNKPIDLFYTHKIIKDGYRSECIECTLKRNASYAARNPEKIKTIRRKSWYKTGYGVDVELIDELIEKQEGRCLICDLKVPLEYDHCHVSGKGRGMLCTKCNKALGLFKDNPIYTDKASEYLRRYV